MIAPESSWLQMQLQVFFPVRYFTGDDIAKHANATLTRDWEDGGNTALVAELAEKVYQDRFYCPHANIF